MADHLNTIPVLDFRRSGMVLNWHTLGGTWTPCDMPPSLVHGIALIRPEYPTMCIFAQGGRLIFQVGPNQYALAENSPRIACTRGFASFGFRHRFSVESSTGGVLFSYAYWTSRGRDFFRWLTDHAADPEWRNMCSRQWSDGVSIQAIRPR